MDLLRLGMREACVRVATEIGSESPQELLAVVPRDGSCRVEASPEEDIGVETALGSGRVRIVGVVSLGTGLAANGACIANYDGFARACPWQPLDEINFGLLKLKPGVDPQAAKAAVQRLVAPMVAASRCSMQTARCRLPRSVR